MASTEAIEPARDIAWSNCPVLLPVELSVRLTVPRRRPAAEFARIRIERIDVGLRERPRVQNLGTYLAVAANEERGRDELTGE
jgi:hypothetical protein